jgi:hypothetical protein
MKTRSNQTKPDSAPEKANSVSLNKVLQDKVRRSRPTLCEVIDAVEQAVNTGALVFRLKSGNNNSYQPAFVVLACDPEMALPLPYEPGGPFLRAHLERTGFGQISSIILNDALVAAKLPIFDWPGVVHFNDSFRLPEFARATIKNMMEVGK